MGYSELSKMNDRIDELELRVTALDNALHRATMRIETLEMQTHVLRKVVPEFNISGSDTRPTTQQEQEYRDRQYRNKRW